MQLLGGHWKLMIVWYVHKEVNRFSLLRRAIPNITTKMLTQQLREMEKDGLLVRIVRNERPAHVDYVLTPAGTALIPILDALNTWAVHEQELAMVSCVATHDKEPLVPNTIPLNREERLNLLPLLSCTFRLLDCGGMRHE
ncbi:MAG: hypothetical protein Fur005_31000 [Roseiflexaceae bacterium]